MPSRSYVSLLVLALTPACGDGNKASPDAAPSVDAPRSIDAPATSSVAINFAARFDSTPFSCGGTYQVGTPVTPLTVTDLRFYVSAVSLVTADGVAAPVSLTPGEFQSTTVALLDFENGCGTDGGTVDMNTSIKGTVTGGPFTQLRFTLGVPAAEDFLDITTAAAPLDVTAMYWVWLYGYKFFKLDAAVAGSGTSAGAPFFLHLGSSGCPGSNATAGPTSPCEYPNQVTYQFAGFNPSTSTVVADVAKILATTDVTVNTAGTAPGCMSEPADSSARSSCR